jgi:hypothetical protein
LRMVSFVHSWGCEHVCLHSLVSDAGCTCVKALGCPCVHVRVPTCMPACITCG